MSDDRKKPGEVKTAAEEITEQPSQHRRRLVKGALSAPVFLTLQNGAAFANTSNDATVVRTLDEAGDNPVCAFPDESDSFYDPVADKVDFGSIPTCATDSVNDLDITTDVQGYLRCSVPNNPNATGGYIVAGSSGGSICGATLR